MIKLVTIFTKRKEVSENRLTICRECEHFDSTIAKCEKCGCFMEFKTLFMSSECPIGKWSAIDENINSV